MLKTSFCSGCVKAGVSCHLWFCVEFCPEKVTKDGHIEIPGTFTSSGFLFDRQIEGGKG